jgi:formate hydrogenlyase subunit 4
MATIPSVPGMVMALAAYLLKTALLVVAIAIVESSVAKLRMYLVPDFLGVASALAILAVLFTALMR